MRIHEFDAEEIESERNEEEEEEERKKIKYIFCLSLKSANC